MKTQLNLVTLALLLATINLGCKQNSKTERPEAIIQTEAIPTSISYTFTYNQLIIAFSGKKNVTDLKGSIELFENELEVSKGNEIEKYFIEEFKIVGTALTLGTKNNRQEKAVWKIYQSDAKTKIEVTMDGVLAQFNITSGEYSEIPFFGIKFDTSPNANLSSQDKLYEWNKEYSSEKYKYSIKVPESFRKSTSERPHIDLKFVDDFGSSITVNVSKRLAEEYQITAHDYTKEFLEESFKQATPNAYITWTEKTVISGENAFLFEQEGSHPNLKAMNCYLYHNDKAFFITATCEKTRFDNYRQLFRKCIESLKL